MFVSAFLCFSCRDWDGRGQVGIWCLHHYDAGSDPGNHEVHIMRFEMAILVAIKKNPRSENFSQSLQNIKRAKIMKLFLL